MRVADGMTVSSGGVVITANGLTVSAGGVASAGGLTISSGGLSASGGVTISSGGVSVSTGGLVISGGMTVANTGLTVTAGGLRVSAGGATVAGGATITGGVTIQGGGLGVTGGMTISGALSVTGGAVITGGLTVYGNAYVSATLTQSPSDRRLKTSIVPITDALMKVNKLNGVYFKWVQDEPNGIQFDDKRHVGLMAQEVLSVLPEVVTNIHDGKYLGVDYASIMPLLIEAVHELDDMLKEDSFSDGATRKATSDMLAQLHLAIASMTDNMTALMARNAELQASLEAVETQMAERIAALEAKIRAKMAG